MERTLITVYTDGACKGNPGPGGWGAILTFNGQEKIIRGGAAQTTNNRMELTAVVEAVKSCTRPCRIQFVTDSTYVMMTNEKWGRYLKKKSVPNWDLWQQLFASAKAGNHKLSFQHVMGHTGDVMNERCDRIAREQARKFSHVAAGTETAKQTTIQDALAILAERSC